MKNGITIKIGQIIFPDLQTSLKAVFIKSIRANGDGIEVISWRADAPSGSSMVSRLAELYGNAGLLFQSS